MNKARLYLNAWGALNNCSFCTSWSSYSNSSALLNVYNSFSLDFDQFASTNQDFLAILPSGRASCPAAPSYSCQITGPGNAKNVITVGASLTLNQSHLLLLQNAGKVGYGNPQSYGSNLNIWNVDGTSFVGPGAGLRKKPDVYAPGSHVITMNPNVGTPTTCGTGSTSPQLSFAGDLSTDIYSYGSSNAAAVATGLLVIIRDWFQNGYYSENNDNSAKSSRNISFPSAALMKGMLIHGAVYPPKGTVVQRKVLHNDTTAAYTPYGGCSSTTPRYDTISDIGFGFVRLSNTICSRRKQERFFCLEEKGALLTNQILL
jgi:hypothetical protein